VVVAMQGCRCCCRYQYHAFILPSSHRRHPHHRTDRRQSWGTAATAAGPFCGLDERRCSSRAESSYWRAVHTLPQAR
jgi:hypothetical protein